MIKIDKGIPIPKIIVEDFPLKQMNIGDSFFVVDISTVKILNIINTWKLKNKSDYKFTAKKQPGGVRVWRIK